MKTLYCWRCRTDVPMLDESEWAVVARELEIAIDRARAFHRSHPAPDSAAAIFDRSIEKLFLPALAAYQRITGFREDNHNALFHHRLALYGAPCKECGRPLRSPNARLCGSCMCPVEELPSP